MASENDQAIRFGSVSMDTPATMRHRPPRQYNFDELKIDRSFVNDITTEPDDAALCKAIIVIAKTLGMKVVAEEAEFLCAHVTDTIQGYYYSKPLTVDAFTDTLKSSIDHEPEKHTELETEE